MNDSKIINHYSLNCTTKERLLKAKSKNIFRKRSAEYNFLFILGLHQHIFNSVKKLEPHNVLKQHKL